MGSFAPVFKSKFNVLNPQRRAKRRCDLPPTEKPETRCGVF